MIWKLRRRQDHAVSTWAGGSTTELAIFPDGSSCVERNFDFRVSSATVELNESDFSDFTGYTRHIMPLEGQMALSHNGKPQSSILLPCQHYIFDGSWKTHAVGTCVDFNLIHRMDRNGELRVVRKTGTLPVSGGYTGLYALCNGLEVTGEANGTAFTFAMHKGDYLWAEGALGEHSENIQLKCGAYQGAQAQGHGSNAEPPALVVLVRVTV